MRGIHRLTVCVVGGMMLGFGVAFAVPTASTFSMQDAGESAQQAPNSSQTKDNKVNTPTQASENPSNSETADVHHLGDGIVPPKVLYAPILSFQKKLAAKSWEGRAFFLLW